MRWLKKLKGIVDVVKWIVENLRDDVGLNSGQRLVAPTYDWRVTAWKGARAAILAGGSAALVAFLSAIGPEDLIALGVPTAVALGILEAARNWVKNR